MDIFGIGFAELVFIFLIALMIFGPRRLPEIAGKAGKMIRDLRNMSQGFMTEWQREITAATRLDEIEAARQELEKTRQELQLARQNIASQVSGARQSIKPTLSSPPEVKQQLPASPPPAPVVPALEKDHHPPAAPIQTPALSPEIAPPTSDEVSSVEDKTDPFSSAPPSSPESDSRSASSDPALTTVTSSEGSAHE